MTHGPPEPPWGYRIPDREPWFIPTDHVVTVAARLAGADLVEMIRGSHGHAAVFARTLVTVICRRFRRAPMSWPEISAVGGWAGGRRFHSSAFEAGKRWQALPEAERERWLFRIRCEAAGLAIARRTGR